MSGTLRLLDSGLRPARENLAVTAALAELHRLGDAPDTLRFQHFPPAAIVGRHQDLAAELNLPWCRDNGIETARRMTGGGAIVMGPGILGWELIAARRHFPADLGATAATICTAIAAGLSTLGVEASFRPRNDIEIGGRKVSGTGGYFDGPTLVYQGTVLIDHDAALMTNALRLPVEKLERRGLAAMADRVTNLKSVLGHAPELERIKSAMAEKLADALGLKAETGVLLEAEQRAAERLHEQEFGTEAFVQGVEPARRSDRIVGSRTAAGGTITVSLKVTGEADPIVVDAAFIGDFFAAPPRLVPDLEAALKGARLSQAAAAAERFLSGCEAQLLGASPADLVAALVAAGAQGGHGG